MQVYIATGNEYNMPLEVIKCKNAVPDNGTFTTGANSLNSLAAAACLSQFEAKTKAISYGEMVRERVQAGGACPERAATRSVSQIDTGQPERAMAWGGRLIRCRPEVGRALLACQGPHCRHARDHAAPCFTAFLDLMVHQWNGKGSFALLCLCTSQCQPGTHTSARA